LQRWEEGWVEFLDKKEAKLAAALLNNQAIGASAALRSRTGACCLRRLPAFNTRRTSFLPTLSRAHLAQAARRNRDSLPRTCG
jgi:hypothetical protein